MTTSTENSGTIATVAPAALAVVGTILGVFAPLFGLPVAMVSVVVFCASPIRDRRLRYATLALVIIAVALNLAMVMMTLPAGAQSLGL